MHIRTRTLLSAACVGTVAMTPVAVGLGSTQAAPAAAIPLVSVVGTSWLYPAFDPAVARYAVHRQVDGSVTVTVTDAQSVWFNGVSDPDGTATFPDARPGDEISMFIHDGAVRRAYSLYVLPDSFPKLAASADGTPLESGNIALNIDRVDGTSPRYEAVVDRQGVPVYTREHRSRVLDLKMSQSGQFTVHRPTTSPGRTGGALVVLDDQFEEVRRIETTGLVNTDDHDSVLAADGSRWLLAYEPNSETGLVDSVIQHVEPSGQKTFQWSSADHASETTAVGDVDYAHINSIDIQPNGDILASFRHLSSVFLIASRAHDGHQPGDVIWKLGGRDSDFTFPEGDGGPCAQHSASVLPNGNILVFDNGSTPFFGNLCVDPQDPDGPAVERSRTRVVEFELTGTVATPVRTYGPTDRFAWFMGSVARLPNSNVLIGWSADTQALSTETDATGSTLWALSDERWHEDGTAQPWAYISYRSAIVPERDGFDPEIADVAPADGLSVEQGAVVPVTYACTDLGGSTLQSCDGPAGGQLDTATIGEHTWTVSARDGAGRTTTVTRSYTVMAAPGTATGTPTAIPTTAPTTTPTPTPTPVPTPVPTPTPDPRPSARPDLAVRTVSGGVWVGAGAYAPTAQVAMTRMRRSGTGQATLRITNTGSAAGRFRLHARRTVGDLTVRYRVRGAIRTSAIDGAGWRTPVLDPGESVRIRVRLTLARQTPRRQWSLPVRVSGSHAGDRITLRLR